MPWSANPYIKYPLSFLGLVTILLGLVVAFIVVAFRRPEAIWDGNRSSTLVSASASGFNFTSLVHLEFKNSNLWGLSLTDIDVTTSFNHTHVVGRGSQSHMNFPLSRKSSRNPTLQLHVDFSYVAAEDPDHTTIKHLWDVCKAGDRLPLHMTSHGKIKVTDSISLSMPFKSSSAYLECDSTINQLLVSTLKLLQISIGV